MTPNPSSLKFVVTDRMILNSGAADFPDRETAESGSKLASKFFLFPFVEGVFLGRNFVTITKDDSSRWADVIPVIKEELKTFLESGEKVVEHEELVQSYDDSDEIVQRIVKIIDEQVRPAVAMDGGDIIFESFDDGVVKLKLRGSCSGCPSSMITLKHGIESMLLRLFPNDVKSVEAAI